MDHALLNIIFAGCRRSMLWLALSGCLSLTAQIRELPKYHVSIDSAAAEGFYFFSPIKIGAKGAASLPVDVILDKHGKIVYFKQYKAGLFSGGLKLQKNGLLSFLHEDKFFLMDSTFTVIDSVYCKNGLSQDPHELLVLANGHFLMIGCETVEMDLSAFKLFNKNGSPGSKKAKVKCDVIQELDAQKNVVFEWHGRDHYRLEDADPVYLNSPNDVDWMHFNAVEADRDGNILVSVKGLNEITKIRRSDGAIMWRLGGRQNQFAFINDELMFKGQHDIRRNSNGNITLFDNGYAGNPVHPEGAKEYKLDEAQLTAELVWSHINHPTGYSAGYGSVQRISSGHKLINYGRCDHLKPIFNLISPGGGRIFEVSSDDSVRNYRAAYYPKLPWKFKRPEVTQKIIQGKIYLEAGPGHTRYLWSTGDTARMIHIKKPGVYAVFVPFGPGGYISSAPFTVASLPAAPGTSKKGTQKAKPK